MLAVLLGFGAFLSIVAGGAIALRNRDRLHLVLGFTAGVMLGVVAFELLPEVFHLAEETGTSATRPMLALVGGFMGFHVVEKLVLVHHAHEGEYGHHHHPHVGVASALALATHSFVDGIGIGLAFQVDRAVGMSVAIAVIAHGFADGLNTVSIMLAHDNTRRRAIALLVLDAVAPTLGAASTLLFDVPASGLLVYLGFFTGFLLYLGASDILPEAHSRHPSRLTLLSTLVGLGAIYTVVSLTGHAH